MIYHNSRTKHRSTINLLISFMFILLTTVFSTLLFSLVASTIPFPIIKLAVQNPLTLSIVAGLFAGNASILVFPEQPLNKIKWFTGTTGGIILNTLAYVYLINITSDFLINTSAIITLLLVAIPISSLSGLPLGILQWLQLKKSLLRAYRWIIIASVGWGLIGTLGFVLLLAVQDR
jgi:energy-converting hydrogenase Eha subunit C